MIEELKSSQKVYGIDVSHWEGHIDWEVAGDHIGWCIAKATDGLYFVDPEWRSNYSGLVLENKPFGPYHYFHPSIDPIGQANHFVNTTTGVCKVYVCDLETTVLSSLAFLMSTNISTLRGLPSLSIPLSISRSITKETLGIVDSTKIFLDRVEQLTFRKPTIYTSPGFWNYFMVPTPSWASDYPLWVAHWGVLEPTLPKGFTSYMLHQYSDSGSVPGIPGKCDEDWFNGTIEECNYYFGHTPEPPPIPTLDIFFITQRDRQAVRTEPSTRGGEATVKFRVPIGTVVGPLIDVEVVSQNEVWFKLDFDTTSGWMACVHGGVKYLITKRS